jgi:hypothetical protein
MPLADAIAAKWREGQKELWALRSLMQRELQLVVLLIDFVV